MPANPCGRVRLRLYHGALRSYLLDCKRYPRKPNPLNAVTPSRIQLRFGVNCTFRAGPFLVRKAGGRGHTPGCFHRKRFVVRGRSGGSGGPLLIRNGEVIGVTFAVVRGFGGSNFGVPIRFAVPLLKH
jgi:hypothetical protein